eukprot:TRINITY_DN3186_c0_g1_i3.p1 TRINITY_DN3186_c0_g1~~TRINITY_DN3186_c0_g1_i3.p1  ORF type:complete len:180 (+),score=47.55 TRINITY_DN3186_c0_g1_i3:60-599(+)
MSDFLNSVKKKTAQGCAASKRAAQRSKLAVDIQQNKHKIDTLKKDFGPFAYKALLEGNHGELDTCFSNYHEKIVALEREIEAKEEERRRLERNSSSSSDDKKPKSSGPAPARTAPPPPRKAVPKPEVQVGYDYQAANEGEINVKAGDMVVIHQRADGGWVHVSSRDGREGYMPESYLAQ